MCLLVFGFRLVPECPLFVAANREESTTRPSTPPQLGPETGGADWFGGRDERAGGTWLGVNRHGLVVAVTNRSDRVTPPAPRSRGLLCRDLLNCDSYEESVTRLDRSLKQDDFAGFNLLIVSVDRAIVLEHGSETRRFKLADGLHVLTNTGLNDATDRRSNRARHEFEELLAESVSRRDLISAGKTISGLQPTETEPGICRCGPDYGTVSASVVALSDKPSEAEYWHAPGPPCRTPFQSCSQDFRRLLLHDAHR